mmetsp:Transcript_33950/g.85192  ORF Transcript_33950/g.85192 Transcript_33950/m.85192 type:complete len:406 (-) Transcript_33950:1000-2217(-)
MLHVRQTALSSSGIAPPVPHIWPNRERLLLAGVGSSAVENDGAALFVLAHQARVLKVGDEIVLSLYACKGNLADFLAVEFLPLLVVELVVKGHNAANINEVDERVANVALVLEVDRQVEEIVCPLVVLIYSCKQHFLAIFVGNILYHQSCPTFVASEHLFNVHLVFRVVHVVFARLYPTAGALHVILAVRPGGSIFSIEVQCARHVHIEGRNGRGPAYALLRSPACGLQRRRAASLGWPWGVLERLIPRKTAGVGRYGNGAADATAWVTTREHGGRRVLLPWDELGRKPGRNGGPLLWVLPKMQARVLRQVAWPLEVVIAVTVVHARARNFQGERVRDRLGKRRRCHLANAAVGHTVERRVVGHVVAVRVLHPRLVFVLVQKWRLRGTITPRAVGVVEAAVLLVS